MERGQGSSSHPCHKGKSTSTAGLNSTNVSGNNTNINSNNNPQPQSFLREQDQYMPIANVIRIMRRILPTHAKISDDAKETIQECVSEFISFVTGEANDRCHREQRKTITAGDLIWAMGKLGFDAYVDPLTIYLARYRQLESDKSSHCEPIVRRRIECATMTMTPPMPLPMMGGPAYGPFVNMGQNQALFDAAALDGYYGGEGSAASGPSSSQPPFPNYDPFGHFK